MGKNQKSNSPYDEANILSKTFFAWVTRLFIVAFKRQLSEEEFLNLSYYDKTKYQTQKFEQEWNKELLNKKPSFIKVCYRIYWKSFFLYGLLILFENLATVAQGYIIFKILIYAQTVKTEMMNLFLHSLYLTAAVLITVILRNPYFFITLRAGMQLKIGVSGLIYNKILRLNQKSLENTTTGHIINLLSNDIQRCEMNLPFLNFIWIAPISTALAFVMLYYYSSEGGLAAIVLFLVVTPLQILLGKVYGNVRRKMAILSDKRIRIISELLSGMKVIKMYHWEIMFAKMIEKIRNHELYLLALNRLGLSSQFAQQICQTKLAVTIMILVIYLMDKKTNSKYIFASMSTLNFIRVLYTRCVPYTVLHFYELSVTLKRVQDFLLLPEYASPLKSRVNSVINPDSMAPEDVPSITFNNVTCSWIENASKKTLDDISFSLQGPQICAIIGEIGSGKSSLLMTVIDELNLESGQIIIKGTTVYCGQQPWIFNGTLLENVVFSGTTDFDRVTNVLSSVIMDQDMNLMPNREYTVLGDHGISLSGGQQARVSLARAIYKNTDIVLMDDPFAAVDVKVGSEMFKKCVKGFLRDKLVLLVTNQLNFLPEVDNIIVLSNGKIKAFGDYKTIIAMGIDLSEHVEIDLTNEESYFIKQSDTTNLNNQTLDLQVRDTKVDINQDASIDTYADTLENVPIGKVGSNIYVTYFTSGKPTVIIVIYFLLLIFIMSTAGFFDIYLSWWTAKLDKRPVNITNFYKNDHYYLVILVHLTFVLLVLSSVVVNLLFVLCIFSSKSLHESMVNALIRSPMVFFDATSSGKILNRFSKDFGIVDDLLPISLQDFFIIFSLVLTSIFIAAYKITWSLIGIVGFISVLMILRRPFANVTRSIKRIEAVTRSPIYGHVSTTLKGLIFIRSHECQAIFWKHFIRKQDRHSRSFFLFLATGRWFAMRLDELCFLLFVIVTFCGDILIWHGSIDASGFGLVLVHITSLIAITQWMVRQSVEIENQMVAAERIVEYANLPPEAPLFMKADKNLKNWPSKGMIEFRHVTLYYSTSVAPILKNLNFTIYGKEKVGIVGRTGAGKSSLIGLLFRLSELSNNNSSGQIFIDGVDISKVGLAVLRSSIAVIPQDPIMFAGTLRGNLDPFQEFSTERLWNVLKAVELDTVVNLLPDGLDNSISEGGTNLSIGQRQLICLARAMLRETKIIVIDEATANVDILTDELIQKTLKNWLNDCTVITIAHRLHTIIDSDRILVMSKGELVENDHPHILLNATETNTMDKETFLNLVKENNAAEEHMLRQIAEQRYYTRINFSL